MLPRPPISTLFPYTTLFRSEADEIVDVDVDQAGVVVDREGAHHLGEGHITQHLPVRHVDDGYTRLGRARHRAHDTDLAVRGHRQVVRDWCFGHGELAQRLARRAIDV